MAVPTKDQGSQILGEIIYVARENFESILEDMDELEGYWGEGSSENLYTRVIARPALANGPRAGKEVETYLYVATQNALEQNASYTCPSSTGDWTKREQDFSE